MIKQPNRLIAGLIATLLILATSSLSINGKPAGDFDGYAETPQLSGPVALGTFDRKDGKFVLRVEVSGLACLRCGGE